VLVLFRNDDDEQLQVQQTWSAGRKQVTNANAIVLGRQVKKAEERETQQQQQQQHQPLPVIHQIPATTVVYQDASTTITLDRRRSGKHWASWIFEGQQDPGGGI